ncbi:MAG: MATE family efflux transporter [Candidatus Peribacteraceae bacterium]|nr:MATE family efflux transporter [Candidatus Peribacteraceae bacterium]
MIARQKLLDGPIVKSILTLAIPIILVNTIQTVYQLIDTFWVGRLGADAVASVSLSFPIIFLLHSLAIGFTMAGSILVAQFNGRGEKRKVALATGQTLTLVVLLACVIAVVGYLLAHWSLSFLTSDPNVLLPAADYLKISFLAMPAMFIFIIFQSTLRGVGEVRLPLLIVITTVVLNFFLDPLFLFGWKFIPPLGVAGVAWATLVTEALSAIIGLAILFSRKFDYGLRLADFRIRKEWFTKILRLGFPSSIEMSSRSLGMVLLTLLVAMFGTLAVASFGIGTRILMFVIIPSLGFAMATTALVGNNLGAKQTDRVVQIVKSGMKIAFGSLTLLGAFIFIFAKPIAAFLVPGETELILNSAEFIRLIAPTFGLVGIQMVILGTLKAAGQTTNAMFVAMFHVMVTFVLGYFLSTNCGLAERGIWIAYPVANLAAAALAFSFYLRKKWLRREMKI